MFITDVLDASLDASTLEILTPGASFDPGTRTLRWELLGINLPAGEGDSVLYAIRPMPGLPSGTVIGNTAEIQFEVFDPITTNEVVNIIDDIVPEGVMDPLPANSPRWIPLSWSGTDVVGEIDTYTIFVSVDGGGFTPFLTTPDTSTIFVGEPDRTYGFICIAKDTAGNVEVQDPVAEATTTTTDPEDTTAPLLTIDPVTSPTDIPVQVITGTVSDPGVNGVSSGIASVTVNGVPGVVSNGTYSAVVALSEGPNDIIVVAIDNAGNQTIEITQIVLNQPPVISCNAPVVLWSPNHELVDVSAAFDVSDPDGDPVTLTFRVFSDETEVPDTGDGTGRHAPDFKNETFAGGRGVLVRSERRGREDGRFYIAVITATDSNGAVTTAVCMLAVVPHDQNDPASRDSVLAQAATAAALVQAAAGSGGALPPAGMNEHGLSETLGPHQ